MKRLKIAIDFDGTCVQHEYPKVGAENPKAVKVLTRLAKNHDLILYTMRSRKELQDAVDWFKTHDIPLFGINKNPEQKAWTASPKIYANLYIDDAALGVPLIAGPKRPYVSWPHIEKWLESNGFL